jgi:undecaprenyl diphosphate synthase
VRAASRLGVKVLTVFAFSTENWKRSSSEVEALMKLLSNYLVKQRTFMIREGVRLNAIGDISQLPESVRKALEETRLLTSQGDKIDLVIALNYGARDEMRRAMHKIVSDCLSKKISIEDLSEDLISSYLDTSKWKDPDLLIRTSGEKRVSNFLLWQISYSEVYISDVLWPDFDEKELLRAILEYQKREHRLGI